MLSQPRRLGNSMAEFAPDVCSQKANGCDSHDSHGCVPMYALVCAHIFWVQCCFRTYSTIVKLDWGLYKVAASSR